MKIKKLHYRSPSSSLAIAILQIIFGSMMSITFTVGYVFARLIHTWGGRWNVTVGFILLALTSAFALMLYQGIWGCVVYERHRKLAKAIMTKSAAVTVRQLTEELRRSPTDIFADLSSTLNSRYWSGYSLNESTLVLADSSKNSGAVLAGPDLQFRESTRRSWVSLGIFAVIWLSGLVSGFGMVLTTVAAVVALMVSAAVLPKRLIITQHPVKAVEYKPETIKTGVEETDDMLKDGQACLSELVKIAKALGDEKPAKSVTELVDITRQIFDYVGKHPDKTKQVRQFVSYYLPTTVKLLKNYDELSRQPVKGENIKESMNKIEGIMDGILFTYRQQLNDLYRDKNIDISADIAVMENMIGKDGMFEN